MLLLFCGLTFLALGFLSKSRKDKKNFLFIGGGMLIGGGLEFIFHPWAL
jgi:hypothetical protein